MKISSVSKKVLAGALSAAMVVAFSPAAALGSVNNGYDESNVEHNFDAGTVTVAPSCEGNGLMTYTCKDGDGYTVISAIATTEKHVYSPNSTFSDANGTADANGFVWYTVGDVMKADLHLKCAGHVGDTKVAATVAEAGTKATFASAGKVTYTATASDKYGNVYTSTKVEESDAYSAAEGLYVAPVASGDFAGKGVDWTNGYGVARLTIANGNTGETQTLVATTTSKAEPAVNEGDNDTRYTAEFALPEGILFAKEGANATDLAKFYLNTKNIMADTHVKKAVVKDGKLVVEAVFAEDTASTAHIASTSATVDAVANAGMFTAAANGNPEVFNSGDGVKITYVGEGEMAKGTARANGVWTIETKCKTVGHDKVVTAETIATKVTKASCVKAGKETVSYAIEYAGGEYELTIGNISSTEAEHHAYVAGDTAWSYDGANFTATTEYYCPVEGKTGDVWNELYTVEMTTNGDKTQGTAVVKHNGTAVDVAVAACAIKSVKATSLAAGTVDVTMTLKKKSGVTEAQWTAVTDAIGTPTVSLKGVEAKAAAADYKATSNFVEKSAKATVMIQGGGIADTKTYDLATEHVDATIDANGVITDGYTVYSAQITLPEGIKKLDESGQVVNGKYNSNGKWTNNGAGTDGFVANKSIYQNADGSYTVKFKVVDKVTVICDGIVGADGFLPTEAAKWTVTDATGTKAATYVATAVTTKDIAHTKKAPKEQKAYTLTFGDGKTVTLNATGNYDAHNVALKTFGFAGGNVKPVLVCSDCGDEIAGVDIAYTGTLEEGDVVKGDLQYARAGKGTVENLGTYYFTYGEASSVVFSKDATFKWTSTVTSAGVVMPAVTATFVSDDGKKEVVLRSGDGQIKIELVDAATGTYKAIIKSECVPAGYKGALTDTKVVSLHDGHSMVLEKVEKASTTKSGFAQYYCNNDGQLYKVAIAKDNIAVSPTAKSFKASALKKAKKTFTISVTNAKGAVSFKSSSKKITVSKAGKVTVKKGTKKGTYKVTVTSKATETYAKATKTVTIKVK